MLALLLLESVSVQCGAVPDKPPKTLSSAAEVLSLSAEDASQRLNISVTGVVTASSEPGWGGQFFVQDATGGVFVENIGRPGPALGDIVKIEGVSHPGAFAPIISSPRWSTIGTAPLPEPKRVSVENLVAGVEDGMRVEISGLVRTARIEEGRLVIQLAVGGFRLEIVAHVPPGVLPESLVAAHVIVRGTTATRYNTPLRHLTSVAVYVPKPEDITIIERESVLPFEQPAIPVNSVAQYRRGSRSDQRVHVRGTVTFQRFGAEVFLQDSSGGIRIESSQPKAFSLGDQIDAVGFLEFESFLPLLRDATLRLSGEKGAPARPQVVPFSEIDRGQHHGDLITLRGRIIDRATRPVMRASVGFTGQVTTWLVQGEKITFTVEHEEAVENAALAAIPIGSAIEVDGVCVSTIDPNNKLTSLTLLLPSPASLRVLARPSWLTPVRLLAGLGVLGSVLLVVMGWLLTMAKKNAALKELIREREKTQRELQEAHDTLEQKVVERSAQLQGEMTARRTAEVQFKAVLAERTRLARDLHDTLEQTLTGIGLHLDTTAKLSQREPEVSNNHLQLARNWLRQSQVELRRSIWDLRSRELEEFDLASALRRSAEQLIDTAAVELDFRTTGDRHMLPEVVEENVLRIGQEVLTNVTKHARATRVIISLGFEPRLLRMCIEDNGIGFEPRLLPSADGGHFGLIGMSERVKRLAGQINIDSVPGGGTIVAVEIPLDYAGPPPHVDPQGRNDPNA